MVSLDELKQRIQSWTQELKNKKHKDQNKIISYEIFLYYKK